MQTLEIAAVGKSSRTFLLSAAYAALGIVIAFLGAESIVWMAQAFPGYDSLIRTIGAWILALTVCLCSLYPILKLYGVIGTPKEPPD
jgi:hypothetical protein